VQRVEVMVNGRPGGKNYPEILNNGPSPVVFSPQGERYAYAVRENGHVFVVVDDRPQGQFDNVRSDILKFSDNGKSVVYQAFRAGKSWLVFNGKEFGPFATVENPTISGDGMHIGWISQKAMNGIGSIFIDGKEVATTDAATPLILSSDAKRWAFLAKHDGAVVTKVMGTSPAEYPYFNAPVAFSPDGAHLLSEPPGQGVVVVDGKPVGRFNVSPPDRQRFAAVPFGNDGTARCIAGDHTYLVKLDGSGTSELPGVAAYSPSGTRVILRKSSGRFDPRLGGMPMTVDLGNGKVLKPYGGLLFESFAPDDKYAFMTMVSGQMAIVIEGVEYSAYTQAGMPDFSPDSRYAVMSTSRGMGTHVTINGHDSIQTYDQVLPIHAIFEGDHVRKMAIRGGQMLQVEAKLTGIEPLPPAPMGGAAPAAKAMDVPASGAKQTTASSEQWKRTILVADTFPGVGGAVATVKGFVIDGEPVFVHPVFVPGNHAPFPTLTSRHAGKWKSEQIPDAPPMCIFIGATSVANTLFVAMESGEKGGALRIVSRTGGKWTREWDGASKFHFGNYVSMGSVGGRPFAVFTDDGAESAAWSHKAAMAEKGADGKWVLSKIDLPYNPGIQGTSAGHVGANPVILLRTDGGGGVLYGERAGGKWLVQKIGKSSAIGSVVDMNGEPAFFAENAWNYRLNGRWAQEALADKSVQVSSADGVLVGGKPAVAYFDQARGELHYRTRTGSTWSDGAIDFGRPAWDTSVSVIDVGGHPVVGYIGTSGGTQMSLVCLEGT
jgi:hypothetical protein